MHLNKSTAIVTSKVLLVPYEAHHVPTYHEWMKSEELQELTASEPLSIEEEYTMQKSWRADTNKLTFIVCRHPSQQDSDSSRPKVDDVVCAGEEDVPKYMIGDVNLFLNLEYEQDHNGDDDLSKPYVRGEIELMIAEKKDRGNGYGRGTLLAFLRYIKAHEADIVETYLADQNVKRTCGKKIQLGVKIGEENQTSRKLFESVGLEQVGKANYFREVEYTLLSWEKVKGVEGWEEKRYITGVI